MKEMPSNYEDFYTEWAPKFRTAVRGAGCFKECDVDDIVQDMMLEFISGKGRDGLLNVDGGYLKAYDPAKGAPSTYVWRFVRTRLWNITKRRRKIAFRELPMTIDSADGEVELDYPDPNNEVETWECSQDVKDIYDKLSSAAGDRKLAELFMAITKQLSIRDNIDKAELADQFGVSKRKISFWIRELSEKRAILEWAIVHKGKTGVEFDGSSYMVWFDGGFVGSAKTLHHANWRLRCVLLKSLTRNKKLSGKEV
jgi:DNA-directed RNA polymerase specialized sigma24 family protein